MEASGESNSEVETTTIESIPDDLRCHILSFLPSREAAATALLSKIWKPLWLSLRSFDFHDKYFPDFRKFSDFVTSFISSPHSIQSLRLTCRSCDASNHEDVNHFLYQVALQGIQELHLHLVTSICTILPFGFYSCKTLVTLELHNAILICSSYVDFPLLKYLKLISIYYGSHAIMIKFFSGCPNVEDLEARYLTVAGSNILPPAEEIAEALPKLVRAKIDYSYILFPMLGNAQFLCGRMNLKYCVYIPTFHNLTHMDIIFTDDYDFIGCNVIWNWFAQVLHNCPKLQNLAIQMEHKCIYDIFDCNWKDPQTVPECLSSQLRTFKFKSYNGFDGEVQFAKYIMQNSKVLQNVTIQTKAIDLKHQMLETFSLHPRGSTACNLHFETTRPTLYDFESSL